MQSFWERIERVWNDNRALAWVLGISGAGLCLHAAIEPQSPGISIGLLALAAGIMSVRPKMHPAEKFAWVAFLIVFAVLEVRAIHKSDQDNKELRDQQNEVFKGIVTDLQNATKTSKGQYDSTIAHVDGVLATSQSVATLAKKSLENVTGGNSFAYVIPDTALIPGEPPTAGFSLTLRNPGKQILSGVTVSVARVLIEVPHGHFGEATDIGPMHPIQMGTIAAKSVLKIPRFIDPQINQNGLDHYSIDVSAQNGFITEELWFRPAQDGIGWSYKLSVSRGFDKNGEIAEPPILSVDWTEPSKMFLH